MCACSVLSSVWLFVTSWTVARQASLSITFSREEYQSGLPFPPPDSGIQAASPAYSALQMDSWLLSHWGSPTHIYINTIKFSLWLKCYTNSISFSLLPHPAIWQISEKLSTSLSLRGSLTKGVLEKGHRVRELGVSNTQVCLFFYQWLQAFPSKTVLHSSVLC